MNKSLKEYRRASRVDWLINLLDGSEDGFADEKDTSRFALVDKNEFNNAVILFGFKEETNPDVDIYFNDVKMSDLPRRWESRWCMYGLNGSDFQTVFLKVRRLDLAEVRGLRGVGEYVVERSYWGIRNGVGYGAKSLYSWRAGAWIRLDRSQTLGNVMGIRGGMDIMARGYLPPVEKADYFDEGQIKTGMAIAFSQRYQWHIRFRNKRQRSIRIAVHPLDISELFKLREKSESMTRRQALRHWVNQHWRDLPEQQEKIFSIQAFVRDYLRGQLEFEWFGMDVKILVPQSELDMVSRLKREREAMKKASPRSDRRINRFNQTQGEI